MAKPKQHLDAHEFCRVVAGSDAEYGKRVFILCPWTAEHVPVVDVYRDDDGDLILEVQG